MARPSPRLDLVARALDKARDIHEYVVVHRVGHRAVFEVGAGTTRRVVHSEHLHATVFRDLKAGRGTASFSVARGEEDSIVERATAAAARAAQSVGLPWRMPAPAAPARVVVADRFPRDDPTRAAEAVAAEALSVNEPGLQISELRAEAELATIAVQTSRGFAHAFDATEVILAGTLAARKRVPGEAEKIRIRARRAGDLALTEHVHTAAEHLRARRRAAPVPGGRYDLLLTGDAVIADASDSVRAMPRSGYGWFGPIVAQASATLARQGLTRYQPGQSIYGRRQVTGDPLTVSSDGTMPFGERSQPFGDLGEPVRRFEVVSDGLATGLALDLREAALRGVTPNGGVRNLVVEVGETAMKELARPRRERPLLEVAELAWLQTNPRTGAFVAELGLAYVHEPGDTLPNAATALAARAIVGGALTGNIFDLFARARFSTEPLAERWYRGPAAIRVDDIAVR